MTIAVYVNATILGYILKTDTTSSQNMGRSGPGLVSPGRFGIILGVLVDSAVNSLCHDGKPSKRVVGVSV